MSNYFSQLPNLEYSSLLNDKSSNTSTVEVKNMFRRAKLRDDFQSIISVFEKYQIVGDDRPDQVAEQYYGSADYDWIVLVSNNIIDIRNEWPLSQYDFNVFVNEKYTEEELGSVHHWETIEWRDYKNQLLVPAGLWVDEDYQLTYVKGGQLEKVTPQRPVTVWEQEIKLNEDKRNIQLIRPDLLDNVTSDLKNIMRYNKNSNYISKNLKKTENIRITS